MIGRLLPPVSARLGLWGRGSFVEGCCGADFQLAIEGAGTYCSSDSSSWIRASAKKVTNFRVSLEEQSQGLVPSNDGPNAIAGRSNRAFASLTPSDADWPSKRLRSR